MTEDQSNRSIALHNWERIARQNDERRRLDREDDPESYDWEQYRNTDFCNVHNMLRYGLTIGDVCALYLSWDCELPREVTEHLLSLGITRKERNTD